MLVQSVQSQGYTNDMVRWYQETWHYIEKVAGYRNVNISKKILYSQGNRKPFISVQFHGLFSRCGGKELEKYEINCLDCSYTLLDYLFVQC